MRVCGDDASLEALAALKPAFKKEGTVTAGNAPGVNDAAAAVVVMSAEKAKELGLKALVTIKAQATSGVAPKWVMLAPVTGVQLVLKRAGWTRDEVDLYELNEAFSVQALGVMKELGLDAREGEREWWGGGDWASDWSERGAGAGDADPRDDAAGCPQGRGCALSGWRELGGAGGGAVARRGDGQPGERRRI